MSETDFEYFEGTKTIVHEDGSTTYINYTHEPYTEPLTPKQQAATIAGLVVLGATIVGLPYALERMQEWNDFRKKARALKREKKLQEMQEPKSED